MVHEINDANDGDVHKTINYLKLNDSIPNESMNLACSQLRCLHTGYLQRYKYFNYIQMVKLPSKKDKLFKHDDDWWHNACVNFTSNPTEGYINGYKMAADRLVLQIEKHPRDQDYIAYPIIFLHRQYIELRLKEIIFRGNDLFEINGKPPQHHNLEKLWDNASKIVEELDPTDEEMQHVETVRGLIQEFSDVDPTSTRFRYATDKFGNISLDGIKHINLRNLRQVVDKMASIIDGINMSINEQLREKHNSYS